MMQTVRVRTAQNVDIEYEIASLGDRIVANVLDGLILFSYLLAVILLWIGFARVFDPKFSPGFGAVMITVVFLPFVVYDLVLEAIMNGQSFGKRMRKIKVIRMDGTQPTIGNYLLRWLLRPIDIFLSSGAVALLAIVINGKGQRLGDIAAGTTVIRCLPRTGLEDTLFVPVEEGYTPVFPQAALLRLDEAALSTVKEVLNAGVARRRDYSEASIRQLLEKTKQTLEARLNVQSDMTPVDFLQTVLKDYNALKNRNGLHS